MKNNLKSGFSVIEAVVMVVLIVVVVAGISMAKKKTMTSSTEELKSPAAATEASNTEWQSYKSEKLGFSFDYPTSYGEVIEEETNMHDDIIDDSGSEVWITFSGDKSIRGCSITSDFSVSRGISLCETVGKLTVSNSKCSVSIASKVFANDKCAEVKTATNKSAYIVQTTSGEGENPVIAVYLPISKTPYKYFTFEDRSPESADVEKILRQIIASVKN